jgi:hypothetical protein
MKKRYEDGGEVDALEAANKSEEAQEIAGEAILKGMRDSETAKATSKAKPKVTPKPAPQPAPKPALRQETYGERAKDMYDEGQRVMAAKRAASAEANAASDKNRQSRILTDIKKKADTNKFMGSTGLKSGGSVSSRADGIAQRGKTRGKMC